VALDRAIRLFGARGSWDTSARRILESIRSEGIRDGHLVNAFDDPEPQVDASLLQLPSLGVPLAADVLARTLEAAQRSLVEGDLVHRRPRGEGRVHEGTFAVCSFWLVDALLAQGRLDEARGIFERLLARANDVGLYSEEIDARSGGFLGNFPQAFTHLGLINSAVSIALCEKGGAHAVRGGYAARARRAVGYSVGWRGALWAWLHRGHVRWRGSSASVLHR
jgi:GH15 family glucan-1,4-alpha-glucosidase